MSVPDTVQSVDTPHRELRRWTYGLIIATAVAVQLVHIVTVIRFYQPREPWPRNPIHTPLLSANDRSRWCTVWSLAERGTFQIDEIIQHPGWNTIDKVFKDQHYYSSKPPMLTVVAAGLYWVLKQATGQDLLKNTFGVVQTILLVINLVPFAISLCLIAKLIERHARHDLTRIFIVFTAAFGTFLSTFLNTLNNHTVAANCVLWSIYPALKVLADGRRHWYWFAASGFFAALAVTNEFPAGIFLVGIGFLLARTDLRLTCLAFVPGMLVPLGVHFWLTYLQTGSLKPFYAGYGTAIYLYPGSYWLNPQGIDRNLDSPGWYLFHCLIGHHGIFSLTPVFLLSLWGWLRRPSSIAPDLRAMHYLGLLCTVVVLAFYMTRTEQYNYGGVTSGLRWTFWLTPLWLWSMIPVLDAGLSSAWLRRLCLALLAVSVFSVTFPWNNPWTHPWLYQVLSQAGWIDYSRPIQKTGTPNRIP
jgi:hypothetical protein